MQTFPPRVEQTSIEKPAPSLLRGLPPCVGQTPVRRSLHDLAEDVIPVRGAGSVRRAGNPPPDKRVTQRVEQTP